MREKKIFIIEKIKKYRKCPALLLNILKWLEMKDIKLSEGWTILILKYENIYIYIYDYNILWNIKKWPVSTLT